MNILALAGILCIIVGLVKLCGWLITGVTLIILACAIELS